MGSDVENVSFEVVKTSLSKVIWVNNAIKNQICCVIMGIIFPIIGIALIATKLLVLGIIFIVLGAGWIFSAVRIEHLCSFQTGDCPYCKRKIKMKYKEKQFQCPLCSRPILKTKTTLENTEPINNAPDISFEEMKSKFFERWSLQLQSTQDQRMRFERAINEATHCLRDISSEKGTAKCFSSEYHINNEIYDVTYISCTCPDYKKRLRPCKHIYALALNLGIMHEDTDLSGIPNEIKDKMNSLPPNIANYFWSILRRNDYTPFIIKKSASSKPLLALELIRDMEKPAVLLNMLFSRNDLVAKIYENGIDYKPKPKTTKFEIIDHIMANEPDFVKKIIKNDMLVVLDDEVAKHRQNICDYYFEHSENAHYNN